MRQKLLLVPTATFFMQEFAQLVVSSMTQQQKRKNKHNTKRRLLRRFFIAKNAKIATKNGNRCVKFATNCCNLWQNEISANIMTRDGITAKKKNKQQFAPNICVAVFEKQKARTGRALNKQIFDFFVFFGNIRLFVFGGEWSNDAINAQTNRHYCNDNCNIKIINRVHFRRLHCKQTHLS